MIPGHELNYTAFDHLSWQKLVDVCNTLLPRVIAHR